MKYVRDLPWLLVVVLAFFCTVGPSLTAPRPAAKKPSAFAGQVQPGRYALDWSGHDYDMTLTEKGGYTATRRGSVWEGSWVWVEKERVLEVRESVRGQEGEQTWRVKLDENLEGTITSDPNNTSYPGVKIKLRPPQTLKPDL